MISTTEAQTRLRNAGFDYDIATIQRWCRTGRLVASIPAGFRQWMIDANSLADLIDSLDREREEGVTDVAGI
jgi:hypothetical protein